MDAPQSRSEAMEEMFLRELEELSRSMEPLTERGMGIVAEAAGKSPASIHLGPSWLTLANGDRESRERRLLDCVSKAGSMRSSEPLARL